MKKVKKTREEIAKEIEKELEETYEKVKDHVSPEFKSSFLLGVMIEKYKNLKYEVQ